MVKLKKILLTALSILLISGCTPSTSTVQPSNTSTIQPSFGSDNIAATSDNEAFNTFLLDAFKNLLCHDFTSLTTYYIDPSNAGIDLSQVEVNLGIGFSEDALQWVKDFNQAEYDRFNTFDRASLSPHQQDLYDMYQFQMELDIAMSDPKFDYYSQLFSSSSGLHYNLVTLFAEYRLDDEQDVNDLIVLLNDVPRYIQSALDYTTIQAEKGLLMTDMDNVLSYIQSVIDEGGDSSILASMVNNVRSLGLAKEADYIDQLTKAYTTAFLSTYQIMYTTLDSLKDLNHTGGYAQLPNGKAYYELLLKQACGRDIDVETFKQEIDQAINTSLQDMIIAMQTYEDDPQMDAYIESFTEPSLDFESYDAILDYSQSQMVSQFPTVDGLNYEIHDISEAIASTSGVQAYFIVPPLDGDAVQQMRVNPISSDLSSIQTYTTVCHEGYPGHMYQYAYMYANNDSLWQCCMANNPAYVEGYATYAQYQALDYLNQVSDGLKALLPANDTLSYYVILLADVAIHYDGVDLDGFKAVFESYGLTIDPSVEQLQYDQLQANPCMFQPYYYGYYMIDSMEDTAKETLGDDYDPISFNTFILDQANLSFDIIGHNFEHWLDQQ